MKVESSKLIGFVGKIIGKMVTDIKTEAGFAEITFEDGSHVVFNDRGEWDDGSTRFIERWFIYHGRYQGPAHKPIERVVSVSNKRTYPINGEYGYETDTRAMTELAKIIAMDLVECRVTFDSGTIEQLCSQYTLMTRRIPIHNPVPLARILEEDDE